MTAPVILVFYSTSRAPESVTMAQDVATVAGEYDGRFLAALVDIDQAPQIAQMMQIPTVPLLLVLLDGRPASQPLPGLDPARRAALAVQPVRPAAHRAGHRRSAPAALRRRPPTRWARTASPRSTRATNPPRTRSRPATSTVPWRRTRSSSTPTPPTPRPPPAWRWPRSCQRTQDVDLNAARAEAAAKPDDVDAQTLVADLDLLGGHVDDAFDRLVDVVRRTDGADRDQARQHLLGLFAAVGNDDPRVLKGRQKLANALF